MSLIVAILEASRKRLDERRRAVPLDVLRGQAERAARGRVSFLDALTARPFGIVAEVKSRSPSGGIMDPANVEAALDVYSGTPSVRAISILTDQDYFGHSPDDLRRARAGTDKPLLRKDFIVDDYQVWEARACGADAILLMAGLHVDDPPRAGRLYELARSLGMDVLFELGMSGGDLEAQAALVPGEAAIWGVNARRFKTSTAEAQMGRMLGTELAIDADQHRRLRRLVPDGRVAIAESGLEGPADLRRVFELGYRAALIGTAFLKKGAEVSVTVRAFDEEVGRLIGP